MENPIRLPDIEVLDFPITKTKPDMVVGVARVGEQFLLAYGRFERGGPRGRCWTS